MGVFLTNTSSLSAVWDWVKHFDESDKYENTTMANKVSYLEQHLCKFKTKRFGTKQIREMLVKKEVSLGLLKDLRVNTTQPNTVQEHIDEETLI